MIMESSFCWDALTPQADGTPNNGAWESPARAAPGLPIQPTPASQGHENSRIGSKPATCSSMSLERYLEHYSLLTHDTGRVKILNPLEQSMLRMQDLKQVCMAAGWHYVSCREIWRGFGCGSRLGGGQGMSFLLVGG